MYQNRVAVNFSYVEHETLAQLFQNVNRGENPVTFSRDRLPDTNPDAIAIHQVLQDMTFSFDVNKEEKKGGHPSWLSENNKATGSISYPLIARDTGRDIVRRESTRILSAVHSNPHYLYFLGLNLFENPRIEDFNGRKPKKHMKKALSHKEAQLLFYFCSAKCHLLGNKLFYLCFCYINVEALNTAAEKMSLWLTTEAGLMVAENLRNSQYTSQYLDPLFRFVASPLAAKFDVNIEEIQSFP